MRLEYVMLTGVIVLALVNILWAGNARTRQYGVEWNVGARDQEMPALNPVASRLLRAQANLYETFPLFAASLLGAAQLSHFSWMTQAGSTFYLLGRVVYLPLYAAGIAKFRTVAWMVATIGLLMNLWAMIFG